MAVWRAFFKTPGGWAGVAGVLVLALVALVAPLVLSDAAVQTDVFRPQQPPSAMHVLGTDRLGRDILYRLLVGTRLSIGLSLVAVAMSALIGVPLGMLMTVVSKPVRVVGLRAIDMLISFPGLIVAIYVATIVGPGPIGAVIGIGVAGAFSFARVVSTLAMSIGGRDYVHAARVLGVSRVPLLTRYVLPNIADVVVLSLSVSISSSIVTIAGLSFLGVGVQPPSYDWGRLLTEGVSSFYANPTAALGPAAAIAIAALSFGFVGEALAHALNPQVWAGSTDRRPDSRDGESNVLSSAEPGGASLGALALPNRPVASPLQSSNGSAAAGALLDVRDLTVTFPTRAGPIRAVNGISFSMHRGEVLGIVGESGSGKSTTALALARLVAFPGKMTGVTLLNGQDLGRVSTQQLDKLLATRVAIVYQDPMSSFNPALKLGFQLTESVRIHRRLNPRGALDLALARLREVQMPAPELQVRRYPHELSGGMRQRMMIAMGLMNDLDLLIADEPTTALDVTVQAQIMTLLREVNQRHKTAVILISHNVALVRQACDRVLVMYAGYVVEEISADRLVDEAKHPYTQALLAAVPDVARPKTEALAFIAGQAPDLAALPGGCPFHPRCPFAIDRCRTEIPQLMDRGNGSRVACWVANSRAS